MQAYRGDWLDPDPKALELETSVSSTLQREQVPSSDAAMAMFRNAAQTLTSINLDWIYCAPPRFAPRDPTALQSWPRVYQELFSCRFPHLRSFQWRNCVVPETKMLEGLYLLDRSDLNTPNIMSSPADATTNDLAGLEFIEAHPGLSCLAWPVDHFFSHRPPAADVASRVQAVTDNLGRILVDLRVDTLYSGTGEANSEALICNDTGTSYSSRCKYY